LIQNLIANVNLREQKQTVGHVISQSKLQLYQYSCEWRLSLNLTINVSINLLKLGICLDLVLHKKVGL